MKRFKYFFLITAVLALIVAGLTLYKNYPYIEARYYNGYINVSGVRFMMTQEELENTFNEKGEFVPGMGGNGWRFENIKIFISISSHGMFKDKVSQIDTENSSHDILGIKVGDSIDVAKIVMESGGFKETSDDCFTKGNVHIQLFGGNTISRLRINIIDPAYKDVVF